MSSQVELAQRLCISKSTLFGLSKLRGAPVRGPAGYHVPRWRRFCLRNMSTYEAMVSANPVLDLQAALDLGHVEAEEVEFAMRCFWRAVEHIQNAYDERVKAPDADAATILDDYTGDIAETLKLCLQGYNLPDKSTPPESADKTPARGT